MGDKAEKAKREGREGGEARGLAPWRPFAELGSWPSLLDEGLFSGRFPRLMDELVHEWPRSIQTRAWLPAMDVADGEDDYTITVELPGSKKDDVHVELHEGLLTIRGEKRSEREEKKEQRRYTERSYGSFTRSFQLPADADQEHLDASFSNGVLTIRVPKSEAAKPRSIAIKS